MRIYHLPLIFSDGHPSDVQDLSKEHLIQYVTVLLNYEDSNNRSTQRLQKGSSWWNYEAELPLPHHAVLRNCEGTLVPNSSEECKQVLVDRIIAAYQFYNSGVLIGLSAQLAKVKRGACFEDITLRDLRDGYTQVVRGNGEVILTCRTALKLDADRTTDELSATVKRDYQLNRQRINQTSVLVDSRSGLQTPIFENCKEDTQILKCVTNRIEKRRSSRLLKTRVVNSSQNLFTLNKSTCHMKCFQPTITLTKLNVSNFDVLSSNGSNSDDEGRSDFVTKDLPNERINASCVKGDPRDYEGEKNGFLDGLGLMSHSNYPINEPNGESKIYAEFPLTDHPVSAPRAINRKGLRPRHAKKTLLRNFIKDHPLPLASGLGRQLVLHNSHLDANQRQKSVADYEKFCRSKRITNGRKCDVSDKKSQKQKNPDNNGSYKYSFTKRERLVRDTEIVVGMSKKSFVAFNKCRSLSVALERITDEEIAEAMSSKIKQVRPTKARSFLENPRLYSPWVILEAYAKPIVSSPASSS